MKKRLLSLLLVAGMLISTLSIGAVAVDYTFDDDTGTGTWSWASEYIYDCYDAGIINGYEDGTYLPDNSLTRAEAAKIIAVTFGLESDATTSTFSDVEDSHWALQYIEACVDEGIINGYEDGTFLPGNNVTRAEMAKMIAAALGLTTDAEESSFSDTASHWAMQYIEACYEEGIITGYEDGTFLPGNNITRAEAATIISRVLSLKQLKNFAADEIYFTENVAENVTFTVETSNIDGGVVLYSQESGAVGVMHDDGTNGDEIANDGIYSYQLTVEASDTTLTYYAAADDLVSEEATLYFLTGPTETSEAEFDDVTMTLEEIRDLFEDSTGYVPAEDIDALFAAVEDYLAELLEEGIIVRYVMDEEAAYLKLNSGISVVFEMIYEGTSAGGSAIDLTICAIQPSTDIASSNVTDTVSDVAAEFSTTSVSYSGTDVTLELISSLGSNQVIFWNGHGGYDSAIGNFLATGETVDWNEYYDSDSYYYNFLKDTISAGSSDGQTYHVTITSRFIEEYCGDLSNDLIILASCHSGQDTSTYHDSKLPNAFLSKGAVAVVGFSDTVYTEYCIGIGVYTLNLMSEINSDTGDYYTLSEALAAAEDEYGSTDYDWYASEHPVRNFFKPSDHSASPVIFGGRTAGDYRLSDYAAANADIPDDAVEYNGHYYMLYDESLTWEEAAAACETLGGYLATITSEEENEFIATLLNTGDKYCYWLGGTDENEEGVWSWLTGEDWSYENWNSGEPTNHSDTDDTSEDYLTILKSNSKWNDLRNNGDSSGNCVLEQIGYICEWDTTDDTDSDDAREDEQEENTLADADIPDDAVEYNGHYYCLFDLEEITSWDEAQSYCESLGGYLACITTGEEDIFLYEYITSLGYTSAYFGLTDQDNEGIWVWVSGETVDYTNWASGEPNSENSSEDFAMYYYKYSDGSWNDGDFRGNIQTFLCEWG